MEKYIQANYELIFDRIVFKEKNEPINFDIKSQACLDKVKRIKRNLEQIGSKQMTYGDKLQFIKTKAKEEEYLSILNEEQKKKFRLKKKLFELISPLDEEEYRIREIMAQSNFKQKVKNLPGLFKMSGNKKMLDLMKLKKKQKQSPNDNSFLNTYTNSKRKNIYNFGNKGNFSNNKTMNKQKTLFNINEKKKINKENSLIKNNMWDLASTANIFRRSLTSANIFNGRNQVNTNSLQQDNTLKSDNSNQMESTLYDQVTPRIEYNRIIPQTAAKSISRLNSVRKEVVSSIKDWVQDEIKKPDDKSFSITRASTAHTRFHSTFH